MSRNVHKKFAKAPAKPSKAARRRRISDTSSSSFDLSNDDEGYSAVEDISDSEDDDDEDVAAVEEENIVIQGLNRPSNSPRPHPHPHPVLVEEEEADDEEDEDDDNGFEADGDGDDTASWGGIVSEAEEVEDVSDFYKEATAFTENVQRHVRFDVPSSESDSTESDDDDDHHDGFFPDIFVSQSSLDPAFRREIEDDPDESSGSGTFWEYPWNNENADTVDSETEEVLRQVSDDETPVATPTPLQSMMDTAMEPAFEEPQDLDGYETDGDTTEEDIPEPPIRRKTRRPSAPMSELSDSDADTPIKGERGQPRVGRFKLDRSDKKPIAVLNPLTRKMMIFTPHRRRQLDLSPEQFNFSWPTGDDQASPILTNSATMMLSAMFPSGDFGNLMNTQAIGHPEAFFPFTSDAITADDSSTAPSIVGEEDEVEMKLNVDDFISWDNDSDDDNEEGTWAPASTPVRPGTASSDANHVAHLTSETVGAFRRNQINQQLILSNQATQDSLAFAGPYNMTALRGLKTDRFDTAAAPLTPMRRHKKQVSDFTRSPLENMSAKRKASSEAPHPGHKKHRSISDVDSLHI